MFTKKIALGVGGTLVVLATTIGGVALAGADTPAASPTQGQAQAGPWGGGRGTMAGVRDGSGYGASENAADLASKLKVSEEAVAAALTKYHAQNTVATRGRDLSEAEQAAQHEKLAAFLATELKVDKQAVLDALESRQETRRADRTAQLKENLAAAVKDGRITQAQADAILQAHDAGALGGGMGIGAGTGTGGLGMGRGPRR